MKIAVDAMGGDFAPQDIVKGSVIGAREYGVGIILVGPVERIKEELNKYDTSGLDIEIVHTDEGKVHSSFTKECLILYNAHKRAKYRGLINYHVHRNNSHDCFGNYPSPYWDFGGYHA